MISTCFHNVSMNSHYFDTPDWGSRRSTSVRRRHLLVVRADGGVEAVAAVRSKHRRPPGGMLVGPGDVGFWPTAVASGWNRLGKLKASVKRGPRASPLPVSSPGSVLRIWDGAIRCHDVSKYARFLDTKMQRVQDVPTTWKPIGGARQLQPKRHSGCCPARLVCGWRIPSQTPTGAGYDETKRHPLSGDVRRDHR